MSAGEATIEDLRRRLLSLDGKGYKAYKALAGRYRCPGFLLIIDHVQGDPYADASRIRILLSAEAAALASVAVSEPVRRVALEDYLGRSVARAIGRHVRGGRGTGHSGEITIAPHGQQILRRSAVRVSGEGVEARLRCALPADGRRIRAGDAVAMFCEELPAVVRDGLRLDRLPLPEVEAHLDSAEDQAALRRWLAGSGCVAFVADGAILPRLSGVDDRPLGGEAIAFRAPPSLRREVVLPNAGGVTGMGIPRGVTLIVGGGFHGKSTLLHALERGVYDHIPGDGRERVVCDANAVKIRSEDGRAVSAVDISPFIDNLPFGRDTRAFTTNNASGSTSQAANIVEALACGCRLLLVDEDTSATNFMVRDERMRTLVGPEREPITPLVQRVRELYTDHGVSSVIVTGGTGDYFDVADTVILMDHYQPHDVSDAAHRLARPVSPAGGAPPFRLDSRRYLGASFGHLLGDAGALRGGRLKIQPRGIRALRCGVAELELGRVEQLIEEGQLRSIGYLLQQLAAEALEQGCELVEAMRRLLDRLEREGFDWLTPYLQGELSAPRLHEAVAAMNRLRGLPVEVRREPA
ncbi:MAG: ABC-ATPase domain-containing protein [Gammaproteobacteria bacterium]